MSQTPSDQPEGKPAAALAGGEPGPSVGAGGAAPSKIERASGLWAHIKEHKILQWGAGYLGAALALAHGQELLATTFGWPHLVGRILMIALGLGLPIALTLAWYHGHKGLKRLSFGEMTIIALLLVIGGVVFSVFVRAPEHGITRHDTRGGAETRSDSSLSHGERVAQDEERLGPGEGASTAGVSLAVLPFADMSEKHDQEYFSDGLSEELLNQLAQIKDLRVAGRTSSFSFKGKNEDLRTIGEKLGINHLLEGSVRKAGTRLRITAQLINAADGSHLWSESYDRELTDVFVIQEEIAMAVADALAVTLGVGEAARRGGEMTSLEVYDKYLRARALFNNTTTPADFARAASMFREVLAMDPDFGPAHAGLAVAYNYMLTFQPETSEQTLKEMEASVKEALARAPDQWGSQLANGLLLWLRHDWLGAEAAFTKVLPLAPASESDARLSPAMFLGAVGRIEEAIKVLEAARNADPLQVGVTSILQQALDIADRSGDAQAEYERTKDLAGREAQEHAALMRIWDGGDVVAIKAQYKRFLDSEAVPIPVLARVLDVYDQPAAARALLRDAFKDPANQDSTRALILGWHAAHFGDTEIAVAALRRSYIDKSGPLMMQMWLPVLRDARKTQGFKQLVRDLGLVDYWRESGNWGDFCHPLGTDDFECR